MYIYIYICVCVTYVRKAGMLWGFVWLSFAFLGRHFFRGDPSLINAWASTPSTNQHFSMVKPGLSHDFWDNSLLTQDHVESFLGGLPVPGSGSAGEHEISRRALF